MHLRMNVTDDRGERRQLVWSRRDLMLSGGWFALGTVLVVGALSASSCWFRLRADELQAQAAQLSSALAVHRTAWWYWVAPSVGVMFWSMVLGVIGIRVLMPRRLRAVRLSANRCGSCGYRLTGAKVMDGMIVCAECGSTWRARNDPPGTEENPAHDDLRRKPSEEAR